MRFFNTCGRGPATLAELPALWPSASHAQQFLALHCVAAGDPTPCRRQHVRLAGEACGRQSHGRANRSCVRRGFGPDLVAEEDIRLVKVFEIRSGDHSLADRFAFHGPPPTTPW